MGLSKFRKKVSKMSDQRLEREYQKIKHELEKAKLLLDKLDIIESEFENRNMDNLFGDQDENNGKEKED